MIKPRLALVRTLVSAIVLLAVVALSPLALSLSHQPAGSLAGAPAVLAPAAQEGALAGDPSVLHFTGLTPILASASATALPPLTPTWTHTFKQTWTSTLTSIPPVTPTPTAISSPTLPVEHDVPTFRVRHQLLGLDCEAAAATQWAGYFGVKINELDFQHSLPRSDNPDFGFVGNVNDAWGDVPPNGYGVYAGPVAALLNKYGVPALAVKGYTLDQLIVKISQDEPVIAWVIAHVDPGTAYPYIDSQGRSTVVAAFEHVIIVTGYTADTIHYVSEGEYYTATTQAFLKSWAVLGNMAVVTP
jgi:uncharacterized protein YvpB